MNKFGQEVVIIVSGMQNQRLTQSWPGTRGKELLCFPFACLSHQADGGLSLNFQNHQLGLLYRYQLVYQKSDARGPSPLTKEFKADAGFLRKIENHLLLGEKVICTAVPYENSLRLIHYLLVAYWQTRRVKTGDRLTSDTKAQLVEGLFPEILVGSRRPPQTLGQIANCLP